jgi:hypothetical protein
VGIGTSSPAAKLDIATNTQVSARFGTTANDVGVGISLLGASTQKTWNISSNGFTAGALQFARSTAAGGTTYSTADVTIDTSGNLLVGATATVNFRRTLVAYNDTLNNGLGINETTGAASTQFQAFFSNGTSCGAIVRVGSTSAVTYGTSSDYRLKKNILPMVGALEKISALKPCTYTWKDCNVDSQGFIAHELAEVCPDAVVGKKDAVDADGNPVYQGIDTSFLVATLTAAIQEQQALITQLQADVAALKGASA